MLFSDMASTFFVESTSIPLMSITDCLGRSTLDIDTGFRESAFTARTFLSASAIKSAENGVTAEEDINESRECYFIFSCLFV